MKERIFTTLILLFVLWDAVIGQQPTEAKIYQNYPSGMQMIQFGYNLQTTNSTVDGAIAFPNKDVDINVHIAYLRYARFFKLFNRTAGIQVILPYAGIDADILGKQVNNSGFGDVMFVIGTNIIGGPPLSFGKFVQTPKETVLGWSLSVGAPTGQYTRDQLINISGNRWQIKPEIGLSIPINKIDLEAYASAKFFTTNSEMPSLLSSQDYGTLKQKPFYSLTLHGVYNANSKLWVSFDAAGRIGGETTTEDVPDKNFQSVLALGGTITYVPSVHHQIATSFIGVAAGNDNAPNGSILNIKYTFVFGGKIDATLKQVKM